MLSITVALVISGSIFKYWFAYEAKLLMEQTSLKLQKLQEERQHERLVQQKITEQRLKIKKEKQARLNIENAKKQQKLKSERERRSNAMKAKVKTCTFWQKQYKKYKGSYEKRMMNTACQ